MILRVYTPIRVNRGSYVSTEILPDISVSNIYFMLQYIWNSKNLDEYISEDNLNNTEKNIVLESDLFLWKMLLINLKKIEKYGLKRDYREIEEIGTNVRGKISLQKSIKLNLIKSMKLSYSYDIFDEDNLENRIIKSTMNKLLRKEVIDGNEFLKKQLLHFLTLFRKVSNITLYKEIFVACNYKRDRTYGNIYKTIIFICHLLFLKQLPNDIDDKQNILNSFNIDDKTKWGKFFERFIYGFYRRHRYDFNDNIKVTSNNLNWFFDGENNHFLPKLKTDIVIDCLESRKKIVIECKYVSQGAIRTDIRNEKINEKFDSKHIYQLYSYMENIKSDGIKVVGVLLYGEKDRKVEEHFKGRDMDLWVLTVDLRSHPVFIRDHLISVVNKIINK